MKSQPLNMVFEPARLAPRTCSPSDRAGFVFSPSIAVSEANLRSKRQTQDEGRRSASAQLSVRSTGKMLDNLETFGHLARIDPLEKQFGELLCGHGRANHLG
jgi:hypothetical protein